MLDSRSKSESVPSSSIFWKSQSKTDVISLNIWWNLPVKHNLRYEDDNTLMAESEEELKSLLMKVKEESGKVGLKPNIEKTKIMASGAITSWEIGGETVETVTDYYLGLQNHCRW